MQQEQAMQFVRRTTLLEGEYQKNFRMIDCDAIGLLKSEAARKVTPMIGTLYLALIDAPTKFWERKGVLHFSGEAEDGGKLQTAWQQLVSLLGCGNSTAKKALDWMQGQGIIGYYAGRNGAGIRIFINRAANSIGKREEQKNLRLVPAPRLSHRAPQLGAPFNVDSLEILDIDKKIRPTKNVAGNNPDFKLSHEPKLSEDNQQARIAEPREQTLLALEAQPAFPPTLDQVIEQLHAELIPRLGRVAAEAASREVTKEVARTREWFETKALPKAVRIAQKESYDVLRKYGFISKTNSHSDVGRPILLTASMPTRTPVEASAASTAAAGVSSPRKKTDEEIKELAESCVALFELQGKSVNATLNELSQTAGSWLSTGDLERIAVLARQLLQDEGRKAS